MPAPTITAGRTWVDGETVTPARLNTHVTGAALNFSATDKLAGRSTSGAGPAEEITCTAVGRAVIAAATAAAQRTELGLGTMATQAASAVAITGGSAKCEHFAGAPSTLTYGASTAINFDTAVATAQTVTLTGNITFTTSNLAAGRCKALRIVGDGSTRTFTFPAGWTFIGWAAPASLAANKTARLNLESWSTTDANVVAYYSVQP